MGFSLVVARSGEVLGERAYEAPLVAIGRDRESHFQIDHPTLSRKHAVIEAKDGAYTIRDVGSQNGTIVNGKPLTTTHRLNDGDEILLGEFTVLFRANAPTAANVPIVQNEAAYTVFGQTLNVRQAEEAELRERSAAVHAHLVEEGTKRTWALDRDVLLIGAGQGCHVRVSGFFMPRVAAAIVRGHGGWSLVRLGRGSVTCRGEKVVERVWLLENDPFTAGGRAFTFKLGLPPADLTRKLSRAT